MSFESTSPRSAPFSESTMSSPRSLFYDSEPSGSNKSCDSSDEGHSPQRYPSHRNIRFSSLDYLEGALKLDFQDDDTVLSELIDLYNKNIVVSPTRHAPVTHVDTIGEEDEIEFVDEPRYSRQQKGKSIENSQFSPSSSETSSLSAEAAPFPSVGLTREDILFRTSIHPKLQPSIIHAQEVLSKAFPSLTEPPARMFGEDGKPLPPTKKEEITNEEREARKNALSVSFQGEKVHSLIKAVIVLESRTAVWKKVGSLPTGGDQGSATPLPLLPELPNPWDLEITHQGLDISAINGKTRKLLELPRSRTFGACRKCSGSGCETCRTCRGEAGNECFWCAGTGMQKGRRRCGRCQGQGRLSCLACEGKKASTCRSCDGAGSGEYMGFIEIKIRRIQVPAVAVADLLGFEAQPHPDTVKTASVDMLWELVKTLSAKASLKSKRPYLPVSAVCTWEQSISHLAEVKSVLHAKFKKGSKIPLRPEGLHRTLPTKTQYFSLPTDSSIAVTELTHDQFVKQNAPDAAVDIIGVGVRNVSRRLSTMLMGEISAPSTPNLSETSSPKTSGDYFGVAATISPMMSPRIRPQSPMRAPPVQFNGDELRLKMLRHSTSVRASQLRRPMSAPGNPI